MIIRDILPRLQIAELFGLLLSLKVAFLVQEHNPTCFSNIEVFKVSATYPTERLNVARKWLILLSHSKS
jgi:hypothetical protein